MSPAQLRAFGLVLAAFVALLLGVALPWLGALPAAPWPWLAAGLLAATALAAPRAMAPVHRAWTAIGRVLGWINTRVLLGVVFFALITPMGLVRRWAGKGPIRRAREPQAPSYRIAPSQSPGPDHFDRPF